MSKIKRIGYQHSFQVTQFLYDKIYFEAELEPGDTEEQVVQELINKCKEVARKVQGSVIEINPEYAHYLNGSTDPYFRESMPYVAQQVSTTKLEPQEKRIGVMVEDILSCGELKILETYRFIKDTNEELKAAYQQRYDELTISKSITKH